MYYKFQTKKMLTLLHDMFFIQNQVEVSQYVSYYATWNSIVKYWL
jgi:hypothetical protein